MADQVKNVTMKGIHSKENEYDQATPDGSLQSCYNFVPDRVGGLTVRRGFSNSVVPDPSSKVSEFYEYQDTIIAHSQDGLLRKYSPVTWSDIGNTGTFASPDPTISRLKSSKASKSIYFADSVAVRKLDSISGTVYKAGLPQVPSGLVVSGQMLINQAGYLAGAYNDGKMKWAVKFVFYYKDANGVEYRGAPSGRYLFFGYPATAPSIMFRLPAEITTAHKIEKYVAPYINMTTAPSDSEVGDEYFFIESYTITSTDVSNGYVTLPFSSFRAPQNQILPTLKGASLYTNPSQEGALQTNFPPPVCKDVTSFKDYSFYANTERPYLTSQVVSDLRANNTTIDGDIYLAGGHWSNIFSVDDWTKGAGWTVGGGVGTAAGAISTLLAHSTALPIPQLPVFQVAYNATRSAGTVNARIYDYFGNYITVTSAGAAANYPGSFLGWASDFSLLSPAVTVSSIDDAAETLTLTGAATTRVYYTCSDNPISGLTDKTEYWTTSAGTNIYKLSTTQANKDATTFVNITGPLPAGTHTFTPMSILAPGTISKLTFKANAFTGTVDNVSVHCYGLQDLIVPNVDVNTSSVSEPFYGSYAINAGEWAEYYTQNLAGVANWYNKWKCTGFKNPTANTNTGTWTDPTNVYTLDGTYATKAVANGASSSCKFEGFGFAIPTTATITHIQMEVAYFSSAATAGQDIILEVCTPTEDFVATSSSSIKTASPITSYYWGDVQKIPAANFDAEITPAVANSSDFGISIVFMNSSGASRTYSIDNVRMQIFYTDSAKVYDSYHTTSQSTSSIAVTRRLLTDATFNIDLNYQTDKIGVWAAVKDLFPNAIYWSKLQQPDSVPLLNYSFVGDSTKKILRILPLRESVIILKEDGIFRLTGSDASNFSIDMLNRTVNCICADSAVMMDNKVYCLTNNGFVEINDVGVNVISRQIEDKLQDLINPSLYGAYVGQYGFGMAYETERLYIFFTPMASTPYCDYAFVYNFYTQQWTMWYKPARLSITSGFVRPSQDLMYLESMYGTSMLVERKGLYRNTMDWMYTYTVGGVVANSDGTSTLTIVDDTKLYEDSYDVLMLHMDGEDGEATFTDSSPSAHTMAPTFATTSSSYRKFGYTSGDFIGLKFLEAAASPDWNFGTDDFTIDFWYMMPEAPTAYPWFFRLEGEDDAANLLHIFISTYGGNTKYVVSYADSPTSDLSPQYAFTENHGNWVHFALVRHNNILHVYENGIELTNSGDSADVTGISIGNDVNLLNIGAINGDASTSASYIDEFRISKGIARWTANFTPPSASYFTAKAPSATVLFGAVSKSTSADYYAYVTSTDSTSLTILGNPESIVQEDTIYAFQPIITTLTTNYDKLDGITSLKRAKELVMAFKGWQDYYNNFTFYTDINLNTHSSSGQSQIDPIFNETEYLENPAAYPISTYILHKRQIVPSSSRLCGAIYFSLSVYAIIKPITILGYNWLYETISNRLIANG